MPVPEAAVNEDDFVKPPEDQIRLAGKIRDMQAVAEAHRVDHTANGHFRRCIHAAYSRHVGAAFGGGQFIHGFY